MTPNQLSVLLSVVVRGNLKCGLVSEESTEYKNCRDWLVANEMIRAGVDLQVDSWEPTPRGTAHVKGILAVELPIPNWTTRYPNPQN